MKFTGTKDYVATEDLKVAVNASIVLERPLLIKGEPGTGKTVLAEEVAKAIKAPLLTWHIKSTTKAQQGLYEYDAVSRLRDSQLGDSKVSDISNYIKRGKLWDAFTAEQRPVLLIDEIDKADIEFPNDLLLAPDRDDHLEQREGIAGRLPAPLLLPLHQVSRRRDHGPHCRRALPQHQEALGGRGAAHLLRGARSAGPEEEAVDLGAARLAQASAQRR